MKSGRTIVAERERLETASERMQARKRLKHKRVLSVLSVVLALVIVVICGVMLWQMWRSGDDTATIEVATEVGPTVTIVDEAGAGVSSRIKAYAAQLEGDLADLGYKIDRAALPQDKSRELLIGLEGREWLVKVNIDRGTAVTAEDIDRMVRYMDERGIAPGSYLDVRVQGKAYYK